MADWATIRTRLHDRVEQKPFWDQDDELAAFNESLRLWNLLTGMWKRRVTLLTVAGQYEYALTALMLYRMRMTFNTRPLSPTSREDLNNARPRWRAETTTSGGDVPTRPMLWAPISLQLLYIWPADAVGGATLTVDGVSATPVMVEDGDTVDMGDELLNVMLGMSLHVLTFKKGGPAFQSTFPLFKDFLAAAADMNDLIKTSQVYRRVMGLDDRSLKRMRGTETMLDQYAQKAG